MNQRFYLFYLIFLYYYNTFFSFKFPTAVSNNKLIIDWFDWYVYVIVNSINVKNFMNMNVMA